MNALYKDSQKFDAIVCLSAIDWDFLWQRTQEVTSQFATMGYPVLFVENTGVRIPGLKDVPRVLNRLRKVFFPVKGDSKQSHGKDIEVFSPLIVPLPYNRAANKLNSTILRTKILRFCQTRNIPINRALLWSYMTSPLAVELAASLPWAGVVIDLVSDPCKVHGAAGIMNSHKKMLGLADVILCASVPMMKTAKQQVDKSQNSKIHLLEDGFSTRLLDTVQTESEELQMPIDVIGKPMVAYIGGVNNKICWEAVSAMAQECPEISFVYVGPTEYDILPCQGYGKNVFWMPPFKEYHQLGSFLKKCIAGLIPYTPTPYVAEMRPAKINEYMVAGLPIVATKLPEVERFGKENAPGIVYLAENNKDFAIALKQAIKEDCAEYRSKRRQIALSRSWESVVGNLEKQLYGLI